MLVIDQISKSFGDQSVLKAISFNLEGGKIYGMVGANGAGKTTLFNCIAGLEEHQGSIHSDQWSPIKNHIGFLQTTPSFLEKMTGEEYLHLCTHARGMVPNPKTPNIFELPLKKYANEYSTGMKKKLALQAILIQKNELFILDEPFNGVDLFSGLEIKKRLLALQQAGKTIILSSHILYTMTDLCDEIFHLKDGVIHKHYQKSDFSTIEAELMTE